MRTKYNYEGLIKSYLANEISSNDFVKTYFDSLKAEWNELDEKTYERLIYLFNAANAYTDKPNLLRQNSSQYITESQLREAAVKTLDALREQEEKGEKKAEDFKAPLPFDQAVTMIEYECLIGKYIRREIDTEQFTGSFLYASCMFHKFPISEELANVLTALYDAVDNLVADSALGVPPMEDDITEEQLHEVAEKTFFKIKEFYFADKLYERKSAILRQLFIKIMKVFLSLLLFLFFLCHAIVSFTETIYFIYYAGEILRALNSFVLFLAFIVLSGLFSQPIHPKSFEIVEIKRLFFSLILPKPRIEAFENA